MKKIILTGGGTAGHVIPNITLMPLLKKQGFSLFYVGSKNGLEKALVEFEDVPYFGISSGKLRRYFDFRNFTDIFRILKGIWDSYRILGKTKPDVVFSKGGFVVVPLVFAAWLRGINVVVHESDLSPGLANRLVAPFAKAVLVSFPETLRYFPKSKTRLTGVPLRQDLQSAKRESGLRFLGFVDDGKPLLLATGGSQGSKAINLCITTHLDELLKSYRVVLLCGKGNHSGIHRDGFREYEVLNKDFPQVLKAADLVVSRAGANTLFELLALRKPNLLVPLTLKQSRGDQIVNAASFSERGFSAVLNEENLMDSFLTVLNSLYENRGKYEEAMGREAGIDAASLIVSVILDNV